MLQREGRRNGVKREPAVINSNTFIRITDVLEFVFWTIRPRFNERILVNRQTEIVVCRITFLKNRQCVYGRLGFIAPETNCIQIGPSERQACRDDDANQEPLQSTVVCNYLC